MKSRLRRIFRGAGRLAAGTGFAAICGSLALAAEGNQAVQRDQPILVVPGYGPGVAGQVSAGPSVPVCRPTMPCTRPFAGATVLLLDRRARTVVGETVTNTSGNFIVATPPGAYIVHVRVVDFPRCQEAPALVGQSDFTLVQIACDNGIR
ncbi:MAG TPA: hypothetical protein VGF34_11655 [Stellaceae bacterium]